ncbi:MAG: ADP-ribosylation factor-like protein, partial [Candidatus Thorarchaeota archaeon]
WDFAGQERFRNLWKFYFHGADVIFLVCDSSLRNVIISKDIYKLIKRDAPKVPVFSLANKQDKPNAMRPEVVQKILGIPTYPMVAIDKTRRDEMLRILMTAAAQFVGVVLPDLPATELLKFTDEATAEAISEPMGEEALETPSDEEEVEEVYVDEEGHLISAEELGDEYELEIIEEEEEEEEFEEVEIEPVPETTTEIMEDEIVDVEHLPSLDASPEQEDSMEVLENEVEPEEEEEELLPSLGAPEEEMVPEIDYPEEVSVAPDEIQFDTPSDEAEEELLHVEEEISSEEHEIPISISDDEAEEEIEIPVEDEGPLTDQIVEIEEEIEEPIVPQSLEEELEASETIEVSESPMYENEEESYVRDEKVLETSPEAASMVDSWEMSEDSTVPEVSHSTESDDNSRKIAKEIISEALDADEIISAEIDRVSHDELDVALEAFSSEETTPPKDEVQTTEEIADEALKELDDILGTPDEATSSPSEEESGDIEEDLDALDALFALMREEEEK